LSVQQSNKILRLIVASSCVFYFSDAEGTARGPLLGIIPSSNSKKAEEDHEN